MRKSLNKGSSFFAKITTPFMKINDILKGVKGVMDEMKIESKFTTSIVSKLVSMVIRKKFEYDVKLNLNEVKATVIDGKTHVHLDVDAELEKDELTKIIKSIGL